MVRIENSGQNFIGERVRNEIQLRTRETYPSGSEVTIDIKKVTDGGNVKTQVPVTSIQFWNSDSSSYANPTNTTAVQLLGAGKIRRGTFIYTDATDEEVELEFTVTSAFPEVNNQIYTAILQTKTEFQADLTSLTSTVNALNTRQINIDGNVTSIRSTVENDSKIFIGN